MRREDFPNPKLNLPKELKDSTSSSKKTFDEVERYLDLIAPYIYTNINHDYKVRSSKQVRSWILRVVSENLLRSLYIRNSVVEAINTRNLAGLYLALKAWFEIVGSLASILDMLESGLTDEQLHEKLLPYALGNKGKGKLRVGTTEAKSVAEMIKNADKYISKLSPHSSYENASEIIDTFFTDYYDVASNPTHPSFDAHEMLGYIDEGIWHAYTPDEYKKKVSEHLPGYGGLLMSAVFIPNICDKIFALEGEKFKELECKKFFD